MLSEFITEMMGPRRKVPAQDSRKSSKNRYIDQEMEKISFPFPLLFGSGFDLDYWFCF